MTILAHFSGFSLHKICIMLPKFQASKDSDVTLNCYDFFSTA